MLHHHNSLNHNKSKWILLIGIAVITVLLSGCVAQAAPRVYRVGILSGLDFVADITDGFKVKMAELGYVEGQNITYDVQTTNFDRATYKKILQKFVDDKVDLILVFPTEASLEAKLATQGTDIPVVFTHTLIDGTDLVKSEHEPGGNITAYASQARILPSKRFAIMRGWPRAKRMWVPRKITPLCPS